MNAMEDNEGEAEVEYPILIFASESVLDVE